jgi:hypothetical protein
MKKTSSCVLILLICSVWGAFLNGPSVNAEPKTIVVPDDYLTISDAINNASERDTIFVKKGTYDGPISKSILIDKTLSIVGEDASNTTLILHPAYDLSWICTTMFYEYTDSITVTADDFQLSNLTIKSIHGGNISIIGDRTRIFGNSINQGSTWYTGLSIKGNDCQVMDNTLLGPVFISGNSNVVCNNACYGIYLSSANNSQILSNNISYLSIGLFNQSLCSSNGIIGNSIISSGGGLQGVDLGCATDNVFTKNLIKGCQFGIAQYGAVPGSNANFVPFENNTFYLNNFIDNLQNVAVKTTKNNWDNGEFGNYWSDYNGTDNNNDGIGDTLYFIQENNQDNYPLMNPVDIDEYTIPEFPSWTILPLVLTVTVVVAGYKKKLHKKSASQQSY